MSERRQKGRRPRKRWHRREGARNYLKAMSGWPDLGVEVPHDGAPEPLPQHSTKRRGMAS